MEVNHTEVLLLANRLCTGIPLVLLLLIIYIFEEMLEKNQ